VIIFLPLPFSAKFENVPIALHPTNFVHSKPQQRAYYSCKIFSPMAYLLARVHSLHTDGRTNDNDAREGSRTSIAV